MPVSKKRKKKVQKHNFKNESGKIEKNFTELCSNFPEV